MWVDWMFIVKSIMSVINLWIFSSPFDNKDALCGIQTQVRLRVRLPEAKSINHRMNCVSQILEIVPIQFSVDIIVSMVSFIKS